MCFFCLISIFPCFPRFLAEPWPGNTGLGCELYDPGFQFRQGQEVFLFSKASRPAMGPTQTPVQWIPGVFPRVKRPGRQVDHSSSAEVMNEWSCTSSPSLRGQEQLYHKYVWRCGFVAVHAPAALVPGKDTPVPIEQEKRIPEPVRTLWKSETSILSRYPKGKMLRYLKIPFK